MQYQSQQSMPYPQQSYPQQAMGNQSMNQYQQPQYNYAMPQQPVQKTVIPGNMTVKLYMPEDEIRKVFFPRDITYEQVLERALEYVNKDRTNKVQTNNLRVYYMDEEKEFVRFDSVAEWNEGLKPQQQGSGIFKIKVQVKECKQRKEKDEIVPTQARRSVSPTPMPLPVQQPVVQPTPAPVFKPQEPISMKSQIPVQQPVQQQPVQQEKIGADVHNSLRASFHNLISQNPQKSVPYTAPPQSQPVFPAPQYQQYPRGSTSPIQSPFTSQTPVQAQQSPVQQQPQVAPQMMSQPYNSQPAFTEPVKTTSPQQAPTAYEPLLRELNDMGFTNREKNIELLTKHNGHLLNVINALMEN